MTARGTRKFEKKKRKREIEKISKGVRGSLRVLPAQKMLLGGRGLLREIGVGFPAAKGCT